MHIYVYIYTYILFIVYIFVYIYMLFIVYIYICIYIFYCLYIFIYTHSVIVWAFLAKLNVAFIKYALIWQLCTQVWQFLSPN